MKASFSESPTCNDGNLSIFNKKNETFVKKMSCLNDEKVKLKYGEKRYQGAQKKIMDGHMHAIQNSAWSILMDTISSVESLSVALNKDTMFAFERANESYRAISSNNKGCDFDALTKKCGGTLFLDNTFEKIEDFRFDKPDRNQCQSPLKAIKNHAIDMSLQTDVTSNMLNDLFTGKSWKIFKKALDEGEAKNKSPLQVLSNESFLLKLKLSGYPNLEKIFERISYTPLLKQAFMSKDFFFDFKKKFTEKYSKGNSDPLRHILKMDQGFLKKAIRHEIHQCKKVINYFERVACNMKQEDYAGYSTSEVVNSRFIGKERNKNIRIIKKLKDSCGNLKRPFENNYIEQAENIGTDDLLYPYKKFTIDREKIEKKFNKETCSLTKKVCTKKGDLELCQKEDLFTSYVKSGCADSKNIKNQDKPICKSRLAKRNYDYLKSRKSDIMGGGSIGEKRREDVLRERARMINYRENDLSESDPIYTFRIVENVSINKYSEQTDTGRKKEAPSAVASFFPQEESNASEQEVNENAQAISQSPQSENVQGYGANKLFSGPNEKLNYLGANRNGYQGQIDYNNNKLNDPQSSEGDKLKQDRKNAVAKALERIKELEKEMKKTQKEKEKLEAKRLAREKEREKERDEEKEKLRKEEEKARKELRRLTEEALKRRLERERQSRLKAEENARKNQAEIDRRNKNQPIVTNPSSGTNNSNNVINSQPSATSGFNGGGNVTPAAQSSNLSNDQNLNNEDITPKKEASSSASSVAAAANTSVAAQKHFSSGLSGLFGGGSITPSMAEWNDNVDELKKDKSIKPSKDFRVKKNIDFSVLGISDPKEAIKAISGESKAMKGIFAAKSGGFNLIECIYTPDDVGNIILSNKNGSSRNDISNEEMDIHRQVAFANSKKYKKNKQVKKLASIVKKTKCKVLQHAKDKNNFPGEVMTNQEVMEEAARNSL